MLTLSSGLKGKAVATMGIKLLIIKDRLKMVIHCIHLHILVLETKTFKLNHMVWFLGQELDFEDHCRALPTQYIL